jgi:hypothetical protein
MNASFRKSYNLSEYHFTIFFFKLLRSICPFLKGWYMKTLLNYFDPGKAQLATFFSGWRDLVFLLVVLFYKHRKIILKNTKKFIMKRMNKLVDVNFDKNMYLIDMHDKLFPMYCRRWSVISYFIHRKLVHTELCINHSNNRKYIMKDILNPGLLRVYYKATTKHSLLFTRHPNTHMIVLIN